MAFQKTLTLSSGVSGNYMRLTTYRWDRNTREAVALFSLYLDAASAQAGKQALTPFVAKLRLEGAKFDHYLSAAVLAENDAVTQIYRAARVEPLSCDFGSHVFFDALDV
jgi:hypothetical protein